MSLQDAIDWLLGLGEEHGVDPVVYAVIWVAALPPFLLSLAWLVRTLRRGGSVVLPLVATAFFFSAPTLYVFIAGRNLPGWVYVLLGGLAIFGALRTARTVRRRVASDD